MLHSRKFVVKTYVLSTYQCYFCQTSCLACYTVTDQKLSLKFQEQLKIQEELQHKTLSKIYNYTQIKLNQITQLSIALNKT